ncbi:MAG: hypothetical protein ACP5O1_11115 [Phycisphaerae bacterium]
MKHVIVSILLVALLFTAIPGAVSAYGHQDAPVAAAAGTVSPTYTVTFQEYNLTAGVLWGVVINSSAFYTQASQMNVSLANGTYNYSVVVKNTSFTPVYSNGAFLVSGHPLEIPVQFEPVTYSVVFNEKGLPLNYTWTVVLGGISLKAETGGRGSGEYLIFNVINGTYKWYADASGDYIPFPQNGTVMVRGNLNVVDLQFERAYSQVVFEDFGLPANDSWFVSLNGTIKYSTSFTIVFIVPYGNYSYSAGTNDTSYHSFAGSKVLDVNTLKDYVDVHFWSGNYTVTFFERGLPAGAQWSVGAGPYLVNSTNSTASLELPNGTFGYFLSSGIPSYVPINRTGTFTVEGHGISVDVSFRPLEYLVSFNMSGPHGLEWSVSVDGTNRTSNSSTILFMEIYGEHNYTVFIPDRDYSPSPVSGRVYVWSNTTVFVTASPVLFREIFIERGLPSNVTWKVSLGNMTLESSGDSITFNVTNGTYDFSVSTAGNYSVSPSSGTVVVSGAPRVFDVKFIPFVSISFEMSGIPAGSTWSVAIGGRQFNTSSSVLSMKVPAGTYYYVPGAGSNSTYYVTLPAGYSLTSENSFNATSGASILFVAQPTGGTVGSHTSSYGVFLIIIVVAVVAIAIFLMISRKGRGAGK